MVSTKNKKQYFNLKKRNFITWEFYKNYINVEPPFGKLGLIAFLRTYSRFVPKLKRREKWCEVVLRSVEYNIGLDTVTSQEELKEEAELLFDDLFNLRTFVSGRSYWVGGTKVTDVDGSAIFNCTFRQINDLSSFAEIYRWLLIGAGAGFSVENKCISKLPKFKNKLNIIHKKYTNDKNKNKDTILNNDVFDLESLQLNDRQFKLKLYDALKKNNHSQINLKVGDSKNGWVTTLRILLTLYTYNFPASIPNIIIDYDFVRPEGERLKTFGGRASGHLALEKTIEKIQRCIETRTKNNKLDSVQITDIICFIAEGVVAGGVRRSSLIALGDVDDLDFVNMKKDLFYDESKAEFRSSRTNSNNSVMIYDKPNRDQLLQLFEPIKTNGDPGFYFIGNIKNKRPEVKGTNPCLRGDTLVLTKNGNYPIKDLVGKEVEIWDGEQWRLIDNFRVTAENQEVYDVILHNGQKITATPYHAFILEDGSRKQLKDLEIGDVLMKSNMTYHGEHREEETYLKEFAVEARKSHKIQDIRFAGIEDKVYCCTVPDTHAFTLSNCTVIGQCGEIGLDNKQCCNLTSLNLSAFVKKDEQDDYYLDYEQLINSFKRIVRCGSRMTTVNQWHKDWDKIQKRDRLLGQSLTGQMDAFVKLGVENDLKYQEEFYQSLKMLARKTADEYHEKLEIEKSASITTIKPEGCYESHHLRATENGLLRVDEIGNVDEEGFTNVTSNINTTNKDKISKVYNNGLSEVIKITLNNGREINCTKSHPLSVNNKWVVANNLKVGDILDVELGTYQNKDNFNLETCNIQYQNLQKNELSFPKTTSEELAWWLGALYANGNVRTGTNKINAIRLCCQHYDVCALFKNLSEKLFGVTANLTKHSTKEMFIVDFRSVDLNKWLELNNLQKTKDFEIPYAIRCSSQNTILSFITGYLDNDGCFKNKTCTITTKNEDFARQLQEVGEAVGLSFSCYKYTRTTTKAIGTYCDLQLSRTFSNNYAIDYVNLHSVKVNLFSRPIEKTDRVRKQPYQIKSIELKDEEVETFDIEVENNHWYWQGCIKSHNSLSQLPTVSSGIHMPYAPQYQRSIRFSRRDPMSEAMKNLGMLPVPENEQGEDLYGESCDTWIFKFPVKTEAKIRQIDEPATTQLERYKTAMENYIESHNVSITVNVDENEWDEVIDWFDKNYEYLGGVSLLNKFDPNKVSHPNLPYQPVDEETFDSLEKEMIVMKEEALIKEIAKYEKEEEEYEIKDSACNGKNNCPIR